MIPKQPKLNRISCILVSPPFSCVMQLERSLSIFNGRMLSDVRNSIIYAEGTTTTMTLPLAFAPTSTCPPVLLALSLVRDEHVGPIVNQFESSHDT